MIEIIVRGIPAPQGSKRHVGGGRMIESSKAVGPWREAIRAETQRKVSDPFAGPVVVRISFVLHRPHGHYRTGKNAHLLRDGAPKYPAGTPDLDKLMRAVLDGLTMGGAWKDDAQVVTLYGTKRYAPADGVTGCKIEITEVAE